jgi:16S rRNA processing protein RimM
VYLGEQHVAFTIASRRPHGQGLLIKFQGMDTPESAGEYRNQRIYVTTADRPTLPRGQYYHHQLIGCIVVEESETKLGTLSQILSTGANDVYVISTEGRGELLLPVIPSVVLDVDLIRRVIRVRVPEGMDGDSHG